jgi:hypothetical protein
MKRDLKHIVGDGFDEIEGRLDRIERKLDLVLTALGVRVAEGTLQTPAPTLREARGDAQ